MVYLRLWQHLNPVFTVPGNRLQISSLISSSQDSEWSVDVSHCHHWTLWMSQFLRVFCCFSTIANKHGISQLWALICSACWRCIYERTDTCVLWAISSSIISASSWSLAWRLVSWVVCYSDCSYILLICSAISAWIQCMIHSILLSILLVDKYWSVLYWEIISLVLSYAMRKGLLLMINNKC